jgi:hypothetical protein
VYEQVRFRMEPSGPSNERSIAVLRQLGEPGRMI